MVSFNEIKKQLWDGKEGIGLGALAGFGGWYILLKSGFDMTFALVDEGLIDSIITISQTTLAEYKVLIGMIIIFATIGFYLDISGMAKKYLRRGK